MRSKRSSYRSRNRNRNSVVKNIAARLAAKVIFDRLLRRRSRRHRSYSAHSTAQRHSRVQRRSRYNTLPLIIGTIVVSYGGYKLYNYYYGEHSITLGNTDGYIEVSGNIMKSRGKIIETEGYDITRIILTKKRNNLTVTAADKDKSYGKDFKNSIDYQLSSDGKYYKFGELDKPYFYIRKKDLAEVISFLQK